MTKEEYKKQRCTVWLSPEAIRKSDMAVHEEGFVTRSDFIEKAIHYYAGTLAMETHQDFLAKAILDSMSGMVKASENRLARLLFKIAVEMGKLEYMLAAINEMDEETMRKLHIRCVNEVKRINGIIKMEDAVAYQRDE